METLSTILQAETLPFCSCWYMCCSLRYCQGLCWHYIFSSLHMFGQPLPVTGQLLQFAEMLRFTAVIVQEGISPLDAVPLGANSLSIRLWAYTPFLQLVLVLYYPF